jgi:uncharacterized membrane protein YgdD (TMEM256/DUF423 family)
MPNSAPATPAPRLRGGARGILVAAGVLLALATALGALGTHALRSRLAPAQLEIYATAVRYHYFNALGLLGIGILARTLDGALLRWAAALVLAGGVLFCGGLYAGSLGVPYAVAILPPIGGLALMVGWLAFAIGVARIPRALP